MFFPAVFPDSCHNSHAHALKSRIIFYSVPLLGVGVSPLGWWGDGPGEGEWPANTSEAKHRNTPKYFDLWSNSLVFRPPLKWE